MVRTQDLADTGFMFDPLFMIAAVMFVAVGAVVARGMRKKETL